MQEYKKKIYQLWGNCNPASFPHPDNEFIKDRSKSYKFIIKKLFPSDKNIKILDLGCGYGVFLKTCKEAGYQNIFGAEIIEKCLQFAKEKFNIDSISNSEIENFLESQKDESFDIITAFDVLEHFEKEKIIGLLGLIYKKLKSNGRFIIQVPNGGSLPGLYVFHSDITHETAFTDCLIRELFQLAGFNKVEIFPQYRPKNLKNLLLDFLRRIFSIIFALDNKFTFSTNLIAVGYKNE